MAWYDDWFIELVQMLNLNRPPLSTVFLILVSVGVTYFSAGVTNLLTNAKEMNRINDIIAEHAANKKKAIQEKDAKLWIKVKHNEDTITEIQSSITMKRMLPQIVVIGTFAVIFGVLHRAMGILEYNNTPNRGKVLAVLPFYVSKNIPLIGNWFSEYAGNTHLSVAGFGVWYFLSAIVTSVILSKGFGVNPRANMGQSPF